MPKISVIMPAYNAERYIREAIDSILRQTWSDFELIIIDDGSTDSTAAIIAGYTDNRIRFCPNAQNMGVAATLNRGLELACGAYVARMDADDISLPERFAKQAAYLDAHPNVTVWNSDRAVLRRKRDRHPVPGCRPGKAEGGPVLFLRDRASVRNDAPSRYFGAWRLRSCIQWDGGLRAMVPRR